MDQKEFEEAQRKRHQKESAGWDSSRRRSTARGITLGKGARPRQPGQRRSQGRKS